MPDPGFFPFPEIKTQRLFLRQVALSDTREILFLRSNEQVMHFIDREKTKTSEEAAAFLQTIIDQYQKNEALMWAITLADQPEKLIGTVGYWHMQKEHFRAELGYTLHPDHWKKGIMNESIRAVISYGFGPMQLHSIEARINPDNLASANVLEKTGFSRDGYFKEDYYFQGRFKDTAIYSIVNTQQNQID